MLKLLSPTLEAVLGGDGVFSPAYCSCSGSAVDSRLIPGSLRLGPSSASFSDRSSFFRNAGEPNPRSAVWRNQAGSFDDNELAIWARDNRFSSDVVDAFLRWLERVGDVEPGDLLPKSRDCGRCCHDKVPVRLRDKVGFVCEGDPISLSCTDPRLFSLASRAPVSCIELAPPGVSGSCVCSVGSRFSGGSIEGWPREETLNLEGLKVGESMMDRARSNQQVVSQPSQWGGSRSHRSAGS